MLGAGCLLAARAVVAQVTVIRAGRLLDPRSGVVSTSQIIVAEGGRIREVRGGSVPAGADTIDLSRYTVLPGLIDAHVHLGIGGSPRANALADLQAGFTTVVDLGARTLRVLAIKDSINAGHIPGPRVLAAGIWVGTRGGVCEFSGIGIAGGPEAFVARVDSNVRAGAELIKVCVTGWPQGAFERPAEYEISDAALTAVVRAAHGHQRRVIAHDISSGGVQAALRAGVDGLAHAAFVDSALAAAMRARGMFVIPTLASLTGGDTSAASRALVRSVGVAHRAGVRLVFGTDGGVLPHGRNAEEFAVLQAAGLSPLEAIRAATINAAAALGLGDSVGVIAPGMSADLIAVEGDPLTDLGALGRVRFVMLRGRAATPAP